MAVDTAEIKAALRIVWLVLSLGSAALVAAPFAVTPWQVARVLPRCESKRLYNRECSFCGMTTAFFAISQGNLSDAQKANAGSVLLYAGLFVNSVGTLVFAAGRVRQGRYKKC